MEEKDLLFGFNEVEGIGWKSIDKIRRAIFNVRTSIFL